MIRTFFRNRASWPALVALAVVVLGAGETRASCEMMTKAAGACPPACSCCEVASDPTPTAAGPAAAVAISKPTEAVPPPCGLTPLGCPCAVQNPGDSPLPASKPVESSEVSRALELPATALSFAASPSRPSLVRVVRASAAPPTLPLYLRHERFLI